MGCCEQAAIIGELICNGCNEQPFCSLLGQDDSFGRKLEKQPTKPRCALSENTSGE
jgi:hypothetical protein